MYGSTALRTTCITLVLAVLPCLIAGCGGGAAAPMQAQGSETGTIAVRVAWPESGPDANGRVIPALTRSILFEIVRPGWDVAEKSAVVARPASEATLSGIRAGSVTLRATAYPNADASGNALSSAEKAITVIANQTIDERVTMVSTVKSVEVDPGVSSVAAGGTRQLTATARDDEGDTVLVATDGFIWSSSNTSVATVSQTGLVTAVAIGSASITATEKYSHKSGTANVTVTGQTGSIYVSSIPSGAAIFLDGIDAGRTTPFLLRAIPMGLHTVRLSLSGYIDQQTTVPLAAGQIRFLNITLIPIGGGGGGEIGIVVE